MNTQQTELPIEEILKIYHWNRLPKGTTEEQWRRYHQDMLSHEAHYKSKEPMPWDFADTESFKRAKARWDMDRSCFAPNRPGYCRANND